jgi:hypothetical protein
MSEIRFDNEQELIEELLRSKAYEEFRNKQLQPKIEREKQAWKLLGEYKGQYTRDALNLIFDTVDVYDGNKRWYGALLATPNRNLIFESEPKFINQWLEELLFSGNGPELALNTCLKKLRIKGASKGLATLLLYLSAPHKNSVWVNATQGGLAVLNRIGELKGNEWGENYTQFNKAAVEFRGKYKLQPQEIDWILTFVNSYVESEDDHFRVSEDLLQSEQVAIAVDDEADIDDVVGEPMELQVMRWTPTNEMGVVALFIEFRKQLGFPIIEVIRVRFPDAAVFESSSKGYVRKYIEFEFKSSGYKAHLKSKRKCHYVVCWENDWKDCPIPVIELKREIPAILSKQ